MVVVLTWIRSLVLPLCPPLQHQFAFYWSLTVLMDRFKELKLEKEEKICLNKRNCLQIYLLFKTNQSI